MKLKVKVVEKKKEDIEITTEYIRLDSALKLCSAVESGGQAKLEIQEGYVKVNGEVCTARGKKLHAGDSFEFDKVIYNIK